MPWLQTIIIALLFWLSSRYVRNLRRNPKDLPLPPGPKPYPIVGNLFDMTWASTWLLFDEWAKKYGDMVYFEVFGQPFLVLTSLRRTKDLLERRSANYSDRYKSTMILELLGCEYIFAVAPYGQRWKDRRRLFHEYFYANACLKYRPAQVEQARALLRRLLVTPDDFAAHIRHTFAASIMQICYGIQVQDKGDPYVARAFEMAEAGAEAGTPGAFWVDIFPIMKYIPAWMPGARFKRMAAHITEVNAQIRKLPFAEVENQVRKGDPTPPSIAKEMLEKLPPKDDPSYNARRELAEDVAAVAYLGGADTTLSTVLTFFLAMAAHPDVMRKAQAEIDQVVGTDRLPDFTDKESLPFIKAISMETLRWINVLPGAIPHSSMADDEYEGYFIPKGTIVVGNGWSILHDPEVFEDPLEFKPERYMKDGEFNDQLLSPYATVFGYGRRLCPGRHMSADSLFSIVASVIATFDIKPPLDEHGNECKVEPKTTTGIIIYPAPFKCRIVPRNERAERLIRESYAM